MREWPKWLQVSSGVAWIIGRRPVRETLLGGRAPSHLHWS